MSGSPRATSPLFHIPHCNFWHCKSPEGWAQQAAPGSMQFFLNTIPRRAIAKAFHACTERAIHATEIVPTGRFRHHIVCESIPWTSRLLAIQDHRTGRTVAAAVYVGEDSHFIPVAANSRQI